MKDLLNNINWKLIAVLLLISTSLKGWNLFNLEESVGTLKAFFFAMYIMCLIGITGLALNKKILNQSVWKFMFGISSLVFVYTALVTLLAISSPITISAEVSTMEIVLLLIKYVFDLILLFVVVYGINLYANKRDSLW